jgi:hypothetical protein
VANAFDQFDTGPTPDTAPAAAAPQASSSTSNPFDQFDAVGAQQDSSAGAPPSATISSMAKQAGYGLLSGIPNAAAGVADLLEKGTVDALTFSNPATGENQFKGLARSYGLIDSPEPKPDPYIPTTGQDVRNLTHVEDLPQPQNPQERIARMGGEGAVLMLAPEALPGRIGTLGNIARATTVGGLSGASGQAAAEAVPEKYKPLASLIGGLGGGIAGEGLTALPKVAGSGIRAASDYVAPLTEGGQQRLAGTALNAAATDPEAAVRTITTQPKEIVPGSSPTTFQLTGDPGLGTLERSVAAKNPAAFQELRGTQNAARLDALSDIQSEGHPEAVSGFFRDQLKQIDNDTDMAHDFAHNWAQSEANALGGGRAPEAYGEDIKGLVNPQIEAAQNTARTAAQGIGGGQPEVLGEQARTAIQNQLDAVKTRERSLWSAVDPEGNLQTVSSPLKQAAARIYGDAGPEAKLGMAPIENQIAGVISDYGQTLPFQRLINLRSAISQAMRDANSPLQPNQAAYGRLSQLRGAIEDAISDSVAQKAAQEQQAVATGAMRPEETFFERFKREAQEFSSAKRASARGLDATNFDTGEPIGGRPGVSSGEMGAGSPAGGQAEGTAASEGNQGPLLDEDAASRLKAATAVTAERKQTFGAKPVSQILQRPGSTQPFTMPSAGVTSSIWKPGNPGADTVRSTLKAAGNSEDAIGAVRNMAAASLRDKATDGIVTPRIFNQWRTQHAPALQALEQAAPGTIARFENAARASEGLQRFEHFNPQTASGVLPEKYFSTGDKGFSAVEDLRSLVGKDKADKLLGDYAADSLRKSAARPDGTLDPKKFEAWQNSHSGALRALPDVQARFMTAAKASDNLASVAAQRKDVLDAYQKGAVGKLLKVDDPADVVRTVGSMFGRNDSVQQMRALAQEAAKNPEAMTGLRKSIVEYMESKLISNTEAATSGRNLIKSDAFQSFLGKNFTALRQVFNDEELNSMRAIAQDLKRANRSIASSKLPGQSNTAQDLAAMGKHDLGSSLMGKIFTHAAGTGAGFLSGVPFGTAVGFVGGHVLNGMREAGIRNVEDLIRDAMLNPDLAKSLMMKAPKRVGTGSELTLGTRLRRLAMFSGANNSEQPKK